MSVIAVANQKGGVGKTSSVYNLAGALSLLGMKVLCADSDPQGNLATSFELKENLGTIKDVFLGKDVVPSTVANIPNLDVLPADRSLSGIAGEMLTNFDLQFLLRDYLKKISKDYDFILIDTPPALGGFSTAGILAADYFLIPLSTQFYSLKGTSDLLDTLDKIKTRLHPDLKFLGALVTMHDKRTALANEVMEQIKKQFGEKLFKVSISRTVAIEESQVKRLPVVYSHSDHMAAREYKALAQELMVRLGVQS